MCARRKTYRDPEQILGDPDQLPSPEHLEQEAALEAATSGFGVQAERLMEREIADRDDAEAALDTVDIWLDRVRKIEQNPTLASLSDVELFVWTIPNRQPAVVPTAAIRRWLLKEDNAERLHAFRDALDQERFDLPDRPVT